jgi:antibiotic biosynthesis monooxygenase (ABM) superfamily enzyme
MAEHTGGQMTTAVYTWDVAPGRDAEFERWARGIHAEASGHPGHMGATWLRAEGGRHRYYTVVNFADERRLKEWLESPERAEWIRRLDGIARECRYHMTGMETWFSLPGEAVPTPPRWKMALVTFCAVYPMSLVFQTVVSPAVGAWPTALRALLFPLVLVPLLTYLVMPALSRMLRRWLYPARRAQRPATPAGDGSWRS